ncbi:hypothetical protein LAZ40_13410 [Cereibacter sphaeroides]|uniref:hypothetical protein n=1 Tax=Cereibacter sphaeroides TaxID=1063 RepID=UPI001F44A380|nr:hypothetical protein [Cereibacter sphaeroides]MCE6952536.1 hypothetical protein [Cereibacter sphaeroides]MCE6960020.1 hypothetical protein [Cereibacter sphaeroides]MCE6973105.1 hypothetical protein [Cereibacter sphaeroides]
MRDGVTEKSNETLKICALNSNAAPHRKSPGTAPEPPKLSVIEDPAACGFASTTICRAEGSQQKIRGIGWKKGSPLVPIGLSSLRDPAPVP